MAMEIITVEDLRKLKEELVEEIKLILTDSSRLIETKKWLRTSEVLKMLKISHSTLQTMRINGLIPFTKIGRSIYYDYQDITKILNDNKALSLYKRIE